MDFGRRAFTSALVAAGATALAGCSSDGTGNGEQPVTATEPNDDGTGTLGELRYLIENTQSSIPEDIAIPLTRMVTGTGTVNDTNATADGENGTAGGETYTYVSATYDSTAANLNDFVDEVSVFARSYAIYVGAGGDAVTDFTIDVDDRYDGQPRSFGIRRAWARQFNASEITANRYLNLIAATFNYPDTTTGRTTNASMVSDKV